MSRFTKVFLTLIALLIAGALLLTGTRGKALHEQHALTSGYVVKCAREAKYREVRFPVAYQPQAPGNAEILLYASQFQPYGLAVPDSLTAVMDRLAHCQ